MTKPTMTTEERRALKKEMSAAEMFLCNNVRLSKLEHVPDGKHNLLLTIEWKHLVKLMAIHACGRCVAFVNEHTKEKQ